MPRTSRGFDEVQRSRERSRHERSRSRDRDEDVGEGPRIRTLADLAKL